MAVFNDVDPWIFAIFLLAMSAFQLFTISLTAYQWHHLLRREDPSLRFIEVLRIHLAGGFVESVTPSSKLGGEAAKVYLFRRRTGMEYQRLTTYLLAHKYFSLIPFLALCIVLLTVATFTYNVPVLVHASFAVFAGLMAILILMVHRGKVPDGSVKRSFPRIRSAADYLRKASCGVQALTEPRDRVLLFGLSFLVWGFYPVKIYLTAMVLGIELSLALAVMATFAAYLVSMLPLTPGGLGTFEGSMALIMSVNGIPFAAGVAIALAARLFIYWFPLLVSALAALGVLRHIGDADNKTTVAELQ